MHEIYVFISFVSWYLMKYYNLPRTTLWREKSILKKASATCSWAVTPRTSLPWAPFQYHMRPEHLPYPWGFLQFCVPEMHVLFSNSRIALGLVRGERPQACKFVILSALCHLYNLILWVTLSPFWNLVWLSFLTHNKNYIEWLFPVT